MSTAAVTSEPRTDVSLCRCRRCLEEDFRQKHGGTSRLLVPMHPVNLFIVCAICGNKRCPHATDHRLACTNSNEPGQQGSFYQGNPRTTTAASPLTDADINAHRQDELDALKRAYEETVADCRVREEAARKRYAETYNRVIEERLEMRRQKNGGRF